MTSLHLALIVFGFTLLITKSRLFACKRQFVIERYKASKLNTTTPWYIQWVHKVWHAIWTCPMCSGAWWSFVVCAIWGVYGYVADVVICFGLNWLIHLVENFLFNLGEYFDVPDPIEKKSEKGLDSGENVV